MAIGRKSKAKDVIRGTMETDSDIPYLVDGLLYYVCIHCKRRQSVFPLSHCQDCMSGQMKLIPGAIWEAREL